MITCKPLPNRDFIARYGALVLCLLVSPSSLPCAVESAYQRERPETKLKVPRGGLSVAVTSMVVLAKVIWKWAKYVYANFFDFLMSV